jgi:hemerythrin superfamily protein
MAKSKVKESSSNAIDLLKQDHDSVRKAFKEFEKMDHDDAEAVQELVGRVCADLVVHTAIEEEIFYPAVRAAIDDDDLMNEADVEHSSARDLIEQLDGMTPDDPMYCAVFTVLCEYVDHHAREEETEMFPAARKAKVDLDALGEEMKARKEALAGQVEEA